MQLKPLGIGVSALCPELVRTRILDGERNRPERYGPRQTLDPASPAGALAAQVAERVPSGIDPADVAARVLTANSEHELYVFMHPRAGTEKWFAAILEAMDTVAAR